jgi:hypothetical protein
MPAGCQGTACSKVSYISPQAANKVSQQILRRIIRLVQRDGDRPYGKNVRLLSYSSGRSLLNHSGLIKRHKGCFPS